MKIYLDVCCLNRPFDDQSQDRIHLEAEAIMLILKHIRKGEWYWVSSEVVDYEIDQTPDFERRQRVFAIAQYAKQKVKIDETIIKRADKIVKYGFGVYDAFHIACAEYGNAEVFLTTDDKMIRLGKSVKNIGVRIENPLRWVREVFNEH